MTSALGTPNPSQFIVARTDYYRAMIAVGGNAELARLFPSLYVLRIQFRAYWSPADEQWLEDYRQIVEAILLGDGLMAEQVGRAHIRRIMHRIERLPDAAFTPRAAGEDLAASARSAAA
jgi:DNA-binding GntR family transcriptional regulator